MGLGPFKTIVMIGLLGAMPLGVLVWWATKAIDRLYRNETSDNDRSMTKKYVWKRVVVLECELTGDVVLIIPTSIKNIDGVGCKDAWFSVFKEMDRVAHRSAFYRESNPAGIFKRLPGKHEWKFVHGENYAKYMKIHAEIKLRARIK